MYCLKAVTLAPCMDRLVGLVVKAFATRAADPSFDSAFSMGLFVSWLVA